MDKKDIDQKNTTIMVVDDTALNRVYLAVQLKKMGFKVVQATSGAEALEMFDREQPDLILMDVCMPGMNGYEVTREIRHRATEWLPIIFVSAVTSDESVVEAMRSGGDDYMFKPANFEVLYSKIEIQLMFRNSARMKDELQAYKSHVMAEQEAVTHFLQYFCATEHIQDEWVHIHLPADSQGALVLCARTQQGRLHMLLAKSLGQGLPAVLTEVAIFQPFYQMTSQGAEISRIIDEINIRMRDSLKFFQSASVTLLSLDAGGHALQVWNGSATPVLLVDSGSKEVLCRFEGRNLPLGSLDSFDASVIGHVYGDSPACLILAAAIDAAPAESVDLSTYLSGQAGFSTCFDAIHAQLDAAGCSDKVLLVAIDCPAVPI